MVVTSQNAKAQQQFDVQQFMTSHARKAIIQLNVSGHTDTSPAARNSGTAFFISPLGYAITAAHIFYDASRLSVPGSLIRPGETADHISGRVGSRSEPLRSFSLIKLDVEDDIALIQLNDPLEGQDYLPICLEIPALDEALYAIGFPEQLPLGVFGGKRIGNLVGPKYPVNIDINFGMSGGPVVTSRGTVFAVSVSGYRGQVQGENFVLPLQHVAGLIQMAGVEQVCSAAPSDRGELDLLKQKYRKILIQIRRDIITKNEILLPQIEYYERHPSEAAWTDVKIAIRDLVNRINDAVRETMDYDAQFMEEGEQIMLVSATTSMLVEKSYYNTFFTTRQIWNGKAFELRQIEARQDRPSVEEVEIFKRNLKQNVSRLSAELTKLLQELESR